MTTSGFVQADDRPDRTGKDEDKGDEDARLLPFETFSVLSEEGDVPMENSGGAKQPRRRTGWLHGPSPPRRQAIRPLFPTFQQLPLRYLHRFAPTTGRKLAGFALLLLVWFCAFVVPLGIVRGPLKDSEGRDVVSLDCLDTFWQRKNLCGLDGVNCQPFTNLTFAFRCPASCASVGVLLNPRAVGPIEVNYRPLVVGNEIYRGDSFICASAQHAGIITDDSTGCGRVTLVGQHANFPSVERNGIESIPFDSYFPLSFKVSRTELGYVQPHARFLVISSLYTVILSLFATSPSLFFFPTFISGFMHVAFESDPPTATFHNTSVLPDQISLFVERLLPALFCAVIIFRTCIKRTLSGLDAQIEKTILWVGGFWFGLLSNHTILGWLPIQRLTTPHDPEQQPGTKLSLAIILIILLLITCKQSYHLRLEGRLLPYLRLNALFLTAILITMSIPTFHLRLHHYLIALLLLPGTSLQTRPSLLYQGFLTGLFIHGVAKWGFASVLQTDAAAAAAAALREDSFANSLLPTIGTPWIPLDIPTRKFPNITLSWGLPPASSEADMAGISILINDVERLRHFFDFSNDDGARAFTWARDVALELELPEYFRWAFIRRDGLALDYSRASTWFANGSWYPAYL